MEQAVVTRSARRRARAAIFALFFTNGALLGSLVLRFPEIKDAFGLSSSAYGATIALSSLGGILAGPFAARAVRRLTSRVVASVMTIGIGLAVLLIGLTSTLRIYTGDSPTVATILYIILASSFLLNGCSDSIVDVAQNMQGFRLQRLYGRPIISAFHGMWSVGAAVGGLFGVLTTTFHISLLIHSLIASCICIALGFAVMPFTIRGADPQDNNEDEAGDSSRVRTVSWHPVLVLTLLVILCISGMLIEDAGSSWATLFMRDYAHAGAGLAGSGYVVLLTTHACGRFIADSLVHRYGPRAVICGGGTLILIGMGSALAIGTFPALLVGFAAAGLGCAASVPLAYNAAHDIRGMNPATGLTIVSWLGRLAFLAAPPLVGLVVQHTSLLSAMIVIPLAGAGLVLTSTVLARRGVNVQE